MTSSSQRGGDATADGAPIRLRPLLLLAVWTVPGVLQGTPVWISNLLRGEPSGWLRISAEQLPGWYLWAALTPFIFRLARRFPLRRGMPFRFVAAHLAGWIGCAITHAIVTATANRLVDPSAGQSFAIDIGRAALSWIPSTFLIYCATVGVAHWMLESARGRQHERDQARLEVQLATAELNALRSQLHPHFLFNTLNTIAILIRESDTSVAVRLVAQLGDVLRQVLRTSRTHETALTEEIAFVRAYLDIEQFRFGDRMSVHWRVPEELLDASVPVLVLQPLVENAVQHGIARTEDAGVLEVGAALDDGVLTLWVADNGPGPDRDDADPATPARGQGVGLRNTRARLAQLYPRSASLQLRRGAEGGARAEVRLPFRRVASPESPPTH